MHYEKEILIARQAAPQTFRLSIPLSLDDVLFEDESGLQERLQDAERYWRVVLVAARIAHQDGAVVTRLQHAEALIGHQPHLLHELGYVAHLGQVAVMRRFLCRILDYIGVGRMRGDEVDGVPLYLVQVPRVSLVQTYVDRLQRLLQPAREVERVHGQHQRVAVDVHAYAMTARQLALDQRRAAARHLVEHRVPGQRVPLDDVASYLRRPVAPVGGAVRGPFAPLGKRPQRRGLRLEIVGLQLLGTLVSLEADLDFPSRYGLSGGQGKSGNRLV